MNNSFKNTKLIKDLIKQFNDFIRFFFHKVKIKDTRK